MRYITNSFSRSQGWDEMLLQGSTTKTQWTHPGNPNIKLNTDMSLAFNASTDNGLGSLPVSPAGTSENLIHEKCGPITATVNIRHCPNPSPTSPPSLQTTSSQAVLYANNQTAFFIQFAKSFTRMVNVGYKSAVTGTTGKLGTLTKMTC